MNASFPFQKINRRQFLTAGGVLSGLAGGELLARDASHKILLLIDSRNALAATEPVRWAVSDLQDSLAARGARVFVADSLCRVEDASLYVVVGNSQPAIVNRFHGPGVPKAPESFVIAPGALFNRPALLVDGSDFRGLMFGLLEVSDRVRLNSVTPLESLWYERAASGTPANKVRSISRAFVSDVEDKTWYYDKKFWQNYLADLARNRFNRFCLAFGLGYNFPKGVTGDYFHFPYPYLFKVPGYDARVVPLSDSEQERNLELLKFITNETKSHGLECQVGIWTHAYQWTDSPHSDHHIEGLKASNHAAYSRDALAQLLKTCPAIQGITVRVHGESGIPEGSYSFWETVFESIAKADRRVEIDMHAKGLDARMIDIAVKTGMPVKISPKYWAEHLGLGYHQAAIRELEMPSEESAKESVFKLSNGARRFLRYGYGDLFQQGRKFDVLFRIWPGTQRLLLWGDPALAAGIGNTSHFCGAARDRDYPVAAALIRTRVSLPKMVIGRSIVTHIAFGADSSIIRQQITQNGAGILPMSLAVQASTLRRR
jgi:hypothetical protein